MKKIMWKPYAQKSTQMHHFLKYIERKYQQTFHTYEDLHHWSVQHIADFWKSLADFFEIPFIKRPQNIISYSSHMMKTKWFIGATLNYTQAIFDKKYTHTALKYYSEHGLTSTMTFSELEQKVGMCIAGLTFLGVGFSDIVAGILPNNAYPIILMLACAAIGAVWVSCSPEFGMPAMLDRLTQVNPSLLFMTDTYLYAGKHYSQAEKITGLIHALPCIKKVVICPYDDEKVLPITHQKTLIWSEFLKKNQPVAYMPVDFDHPIYILFSSGTTGMPKCIVHRTGGVLLQHLKELSLHSNLTSSDNLFFYTTCGWMMWNWMVSALALGTTLTLYDGAPNVPTSYQLFDIAENTQATALGLSAKYLSMLEKEDSSKPYQTSLQSLKKIFTTGSPLLPSQYDFVDAYIKRGIQVSSISGGTDIVSCFALGNPLKPVIKGEIQSLGLGMDVAVLNSQGDCVIDETGELVCRQPFVSMPLQFLNDDTGNAYYNAYFSRFDNIWTHGDFAKITSSNGVIIYGRSDTTLNPGGVRIGTAEIYRQVEKISAVKDCIVAGLKKENDECVILFVKLAEGAMLTDSLVLSIKSILKTQTSPRHVPDKIIQVLDIPKTINNKPVEKAVSQIINGETVKNLQSIANPESLQYFKSLK